MKRWMVSALASMLCLLVVMGCNRGGCGSKREVEIPEVSALDQLRIEIADLKIEQGRDAAMARMKELLKDPAKAEFKPNLIEWLLDELLREDTIAVVQDTFLEVAAGDEQVAQVGFGKVTSVSATTNAADLVVWHDKVLASGITDEAKAYVWPLRARAYVASDEFDSVAFRVGEVLALQPPHLGARAFQGIISEGLRGNKHAGLMALVSAARESAPDRTDLTQLLLGVEADVLLGQGDLSAVEALLLKHADAMGDAAVAGRAVSLVKMASDSNDADLAKRMIAWVAASAEARPRTRDKVMTKWIAMLPAGQDPGEFLDRVKQALDVGCPAGQVLVPFRNGFYAIMSTRNKERQTACLNLAETFRTSEDVTASLGQSVGLMLLDGAFYMNDFRRAYDLVVAGIPGQDEEWHVEIKDKVGAHLALQEGRPEDAITLFRKHMDRVLAWDAPVTNPESGTSMIKEAVLGFNEKRIGDIYATMAGRGEDAKAAYGRAREWYKKALDILDKDSREYKDAAAELAQVPGPTVE